MTALNLIDECQIENLYLWVDDQDRVEMHLCSWALRNFDFLKTILLIVKSTSPSLCSKLPNSHTKRQTMQGKQKIRTSL
jgi:hypothetical protein